MYQHFKSLKIITFPSNFIYEAIVFCVREYDLVQGQDVHSYYTRSNTIQTGE